MHGATGLLFDVTRPALYPSRVIKSFRCKDTDTLFTTGRCAKFANLKRVVERKLAQLDAAVNLDDLKVPPGNRLEPLAGDRDGQYSIRINDQFRLCFVWTEDGPADVEIVDYH